MNRQWLFQKPSGPFEFTRCDVQSDTGSCIISEREERRKSPQQYTWYILFLCISPLSPSLPFVPRQATDRACPTWDSQQMAGGNARDVLVGAVSAWKQHARQGQHNYLRLKGVLCDFDCCSGALYATCSAMSEIDSLPLQHSISPECRTWFWSHR
jgi:hypothetical protein